MENVHSMLEEFATKLKSKIEKVPVADGEFLQHTMSAQ